MNFDRNLFLASIAALLLVVTLAVVASPETVLAVTATVTAAPTLFFKL